MNHHNEPFHAETVDEHIEWLLRETAQDQQSPGAPHLSNTTEARLVHDVRNLAQHDGQRLARIRERLVAHAAAAPISTPLAPLQEAATDPTPRKMPASNGWESSLQDRTFMPGLDTQEMPMLELTTLPSRPPAQPRKTGAKRLSRRMQVLVAVLILGILLGGFIKVHSLEIQGAHVTPPACQPSSWKQYAPHSPDANETLHAVVAISNNDAWAVGAAARLPAPGKTYSLQDMTTLIEHWDGTDWQIVPSPEGANGNGVLTGVAAASASDIWAVGSYVTSQGRLTLIEHWNGRQWSIIPSPNRIGDNVLNALTVVSTNDVWVAGQTSSVPLMEHWDGKIWSIVPGIQGVSGSLRDITAISANNIWAVGTILTSTKQSGLIEHWNGQQWTIMPTSFSGQFLLKVSALSANDVWTLVSGQPNYTALEHWDGQRWNLVPAPEMPANDGGEWNAIAVAAPQDIWAIGSTISDLVIAHWDGKTWRQQLLIPMQPSAMGLSPGITVSSAHQVWAVGSSFDQNYPALIEGRLTCP